MAVLEDPANKSAPLVPTTLREIVPNTVEPLKYVAVIGWVPLFGSISTPNKVMGVPNVMVNVVRPVVIARTFGVALSTAGGEFHVAQPPAGT